VENWYAVIFLLTLLSKNFVIGLYTSPHLVAVRERIRINGTPLPEHEFARYFFEVWDKLIANNTVSCFTRAHRGVA
jgi:folylpolyglutamate synthase